MENRPSGRPWLLRLASQVRMESQPEPPQPQPSPPRPAPLPLRRGPLLPPQTPPPPPPREVMPAKTTNAAAAAASATNQAAKPTGPLPSPRANPMVQRLESPRLAPAAPVLESPLPSLKPIKTTRSPAPASFQSPDGNSAQPHSAALNPHPEPEPARTEPEPNRGSTQKNSSEELLNNSRHSSINHSDSVNGEKIHPATGNRAGASPTYKRKEEEETGTLTIAGQNTGAIMELGSSHGDRIRKQRRDRVKGDAKNSGGAAKQKPMVSPANSNVQSVNNSLLLDTFCSVGVPGVRINLVRNINIK